MDDAVGVHVADGGDHDVHNVPSVVLREVLAGDDSVKQLASRDQLHHDVHPPLLLVDRLELDYMRVVIDLSS